MFKLSFAIAIMSIAASGQCWAGPLHAVKAIDGYHCMALNLTDAEMADPNINVPVKDSPDTNAPNIGIASAVVIASDTTRPQNGFSQILFPTGKEGWVETSLLKPWKALDGSPTACVPTLMSNGRVGFSPRRPD